jgi:hypothetical protein
MDISIRGSRIRSLLVASTHLMAVVALILAHVDIPLKLALGVALLASVWTALRHCLLYDPRCVRRLVCTDGQFRLTLASGAEVTVVLSGSSCIWYWLTVAGFRDPAGIRYDVVLLPDSADINEFRRARVFLKLFNRNAAE